LIVLLHEFGHCLACRWWGGEADEILMWPLGGLAYCRPLHHWRANLATVVGGPAVNVGICVITGIALGVLTGVWWGVAIPNPLEPFAPIVIEVEIARSIWRQALYTVNAMSFILLLFNLLPIFPLDGGRIVQCLMWPKVGYSRSMIYSVRAGYVDAIALFIFGAVTYNLWIVGISLFGAATCYITQKQVQWTDAAMGIESDEYALSLHQGPDEVESSVETRTSRQALRQEQREQQEAAEVDRILQKIAASGLDSLTRSERGLLKRVTERKRHQ
jgi:Zn-dependent protease